MRERSTWNRDKVASTFVKLAEDVVKEHLDAQPAIDAYKIDSDFNETVTEDDHSDKDSDGNTLRNEIGQAEFRSDTFKNAGVDFAAINEKALLATKVAALMLSKTASSSDIESQALELMSVKASDLQKTYSRLAAQQEQAEETQAKQAAQQEADKEEQAQAKQAQDQQQEQAEGQQKQAQQEQAEETQEAQAKQAQDQQQAEETQAKQAAQQEQAEEQTQAKQASQQMQALSLKMQAAIQNGDVQAQQQVMQAMQQVMQAQQQVMQAQDVEMTDDELVNSMFEEPVDSYSDLDDFELGAPDMGLDDFQDDGQDLGGLFASDELQAAMEMQALQNGFSMQASTTRTVGTRPTGGVSQLGRVASASSSGSSDLSNLWESAPDVSSKFR